MPALDVLAENFLAAAQADGGVITFVGAGGTRPTYDGLHGTWSGGSSATDPTGYAIQTKGDPDRWSALGLVLINPIRLLVAALNLSIVPAPDMRIAFAGTSYTIKLAEPHGPNGTPIYYDVSGTT